ncbi:MAG TPA: DUF2125 domain-containing protein [Acetobacteraceae bacterium]
MRRRLLISLTLTVAAFAVGVSAYWYVLTERLSAGFTTWVEGRRADGWTIGYTDVVRAGWPVSARLVVPGFRITGGQPEIPAGVSWSAARLTLDIHLLHPADLVLQASGEQRLGPAGQPGYPYSAELTRVTLPLNDPAAPALISAQMVRTRTSGLTIGDVEGSLAVATDASSMNSAAALRLSAASITLPAAVPWPLGAHIASLAIDGAMTGPLPAPTAPAAAVRAWRDGGGKLHIHHLDMRWGPLESSLIATVSLDASLQPVAEGRVVASNYGPALDSLAAHHVIGNDAALAAKAVLSLLAKVPGPGEPPQVEVPFTVRAGTVSARGIPLAKVPEVHWPEAAPEP